MRVATEEFFSVMHSCCCLTSLGLGLNILVLLPSLSVTVPENLRNNSKNVKSHLLDIEKNVKKRTYSFTGHLITQPLITQLPKVSAGKSRSPTSNILLRSADTRNYATENCG